MIQVRVDSRRLGEAVVVTLAGELDHSEAAEVEARVRAVEADVPPVLVLDLGELGYMDSSGVRLVLEADERARDAGRRLAVVPGAGAPRRVLALLGLLERLDVVADRDEALGPRTSPAES